MAKYDEFNRPKITNEGDITYNKDATGKFTYTNDIPHTVNEGTLNAKKQEYYNYHDAADYRAVQSENKPLQTSGAQPTLSESLTTASNPAASSFIATHLTTVAVVAATVTTSVLTVINLPISLDVSLYSATSDSLIFNIKQSDDEHNLLLAYLDDGTNYYEQEIMEGCYLVFEDLYPETEYNLEIYDYSFNEDEPEKMDEEYERTPVFKRSYRTLAESEEQAFIEEAFLSSDENDKPMLFFMVHFSSNKKKQFYTVSVQNSKGKEIYTTDSTEEFKEYQVSVPEDESEFYIAVKINNQLKDFYTVSAYEELIYDYDNISWSWDGENAYATIPSNYGDFMREGTVEMVSETQPTCEEDGVYILRAYVTDDYGTAYYSDYQEFVLTATGHDYVVEWSWEPSDDIHTGDEPVTETEVTTYDATAILTCSICGDVHEVSGEVTYDVVEVDCTTDGSITYHAVATYLNEDYTDEYIVNTGTAYGHTYEENWEWASDFSGATLYLTCLNCGEEHELSGTVSISDDSEATCTEDGTIIYIATVTYDNIVYNDSQEDENGTALGHDYVATWNWTSDHDATLNLDCSRCDDSHIITATVNMETTEPSCTVDGADYYYASATYEGVEYTDEQIEVFEPAYGHSYDANWEWASDYSSATLYLTCASCEDEQEIVVASTIASETPVSCETDGLIIYNVTTTYEDIEYSDNQEVPLAATGHDYEANWNWSINEDTGGANVTLDLTCKNCNDTHHFDEIEPMVIDETGVSCTEDGSTVYEATVVYNDVEYTDQHTFVEGAYGHDYEENWEWNSDYTEATLTLVCRNCEETIGPLDATIESEMGTPPGATAPELIYTATVVYEGVTYTDQP